MKWESDMIYSIATQMHIVIHTTEYQPIVHNLKSENSNRYLSTHVHSRIIPNSGIMATQMSIDRWMDKQNVLHIYIYIYSKG